jgi:hypothetical protein
VKEAVREKIEKYEEQDIMPMLKQLLERNVREKK